MAYKPKVLTSTEGGTGSPITSPTSRKILVSDGTNFIASTETYAVPGTTGNVLTSDGTNWTSAAATGGGLLTATLTLTSAQIKALNATPIQLIAAQGSNKVIHIISISYKFNYGGSNVFVAAASQTISPYYNNNAQIATNIASLVSNTAIVSNANKFASAQMAVNLGNQVAGVLDNTNIAMWNPIATEITGNAGNNNTIQIDCLYRVVTW